MHVNAIDAILLFAGFAIIVYGPWQTVCTDYARQILFEIRDEIFDMAAAGKMSFNSAGYRTIRSSIESNIQYAHTLTLWRFLLAVHTSVRHGSFNRPSELTNAVNAIENPEVKKRIVELQGRIAFANIAMMTAKSPLFLVILLVVYTAEKIGQMLNLAKDGLKPLVTSAGEAIMLEAEAACCPA